MKRLDHVIADDETDFSDGADDPYDGEDDASHIISDLTHTYAELSPGLPTKAYEEESVLRPCPSCPDDPLQAVAHSNRSRTSPYPPLHLGDADSRPKTSNQDSIIVSMGLCQGRQAKGIEDQYTPG
jgi:hypothetical protein